jgi:hypothetical protein
MKSATILDFELKQRMTRRQIHIISLARIQPVTINLRESGLVRSVQQISDLIDAVLLG